MACVTSSSGLAPSELPALLGTGLGWEGAEYLRLGRVHVPVSLSQAGTLPGAGESLQSSSQFFPDSLCGQTQRPPLWRRPIS